MQGYLADYKLTYDQYVIYMSRDGIWGDLLCNYILSLILPVPYMVISAKLTWSANQERSNAQLFPEQYDIVVVYNNKNHYLSSSKFSTIQNHFN